MLQQLSSRFAEIFGYPAAFIFFCPGRVNLIGEHIDYNGGKVMPFGIEAGTWLLAGLNETGRMRLRSHILPEVYDGDVDCPPAPGSEWFHYPLGVIQMLRLQGLKEIPGLDFYYGGNLPMGAGLSSSASIEVVTAFALNRLLNLRLNLTEIALLARQAENEYMGVPCGIMDQYAVAHAKQNQVMLLDCAAVTHEQLPFETGLYQLLVINTNKPRQLVESKYAERHGECMEALRRLRQALPLEHLCGLNFHQFEEYRHLLNDAVLEKRVLHIISEHFRVGEAVDALRRGRMETVGKLLSASHRSLRGFYEVTGPELDAVYDFASRFTGCAGARMTGAGFGGCAIALVERPHVTAFTRELEAFYHNATGYACTVFETAPAEGVRMLHGDLPA